MCMRMYFCDMSCFRKSSLLIILIGFRICDSETATTRNTAPTLKSDREICTRPNECLGRLCEENWIRSDKSGESVRQCCSHFEGETCIEHSCCWDLSCNSSTHICEKLLEDGMSCEIQDPHLCEGGKCVYSQMSDKTICCQANPHEYCYSSADCCGDYLCVNNFCEKLIDGAFCEPEFPDLCDGGNCVYNTAAKGDVCCSVAYEDVCRSDKSCCDPYSCIHGQCLLRLPNGKKCDSHGDCLEKHCGWIGNLDVFHCCSVMEGERCSNASDCCGGCGRDGICDFYRTGRGGTNTGKSKISKTVPPEWRHS